MCWCKQQYYDELFHDRNLENIWECNTAGDFYDDDEVLCRYGLATNRTGWPWSRVHTRGSAWWASRWRWRTLPSLRWLVITIETCGYDDTVTIIGWDCGGGDCRGLMWRWGRSGRGSWPCSWPRRSWSWPTEWRGCSRGHLALLLILEQIVYFLILGAWLVLFPHPGYFIL